MYSIMIEEAEKRYDERSNHRRLQGVGISVIYVIKVLKPKVVSCQSLCFEYSEHV